MRIHFHGAARTVTGSKHLLQLEHGKNLLLDCGMFQGMGKDTIGLNSHFGFHPMHVDYVVLSHAHIDHCGLLPRLVKEGFEGRIYCTPATRDLCEIMLKDSAFIQEADTRFINKKRLLQEKEPIEPIYTLKDVEDTLPLFTVVPYNHSFKIDDFVQVTFTDNGHILGSATISLRILEGSEIKRICFTGDIGRYGTVLLRDPQSFPQADVILCESTYGDRLHDEIEHAAQGILDAMIRTCTEKKGKLIIPAFSLGRTQEVVYLLNKLDLHGLLPNVPIYVDSPLAVNATDITRKHTECLNADVQNFAENRPDPFGFEKLHYITDKKESQALNDSNQPCIIISASGMAEAGRVKHHILHNISDPRNTILIIGYAEPLSLAGRLRSGATEVKIFGDPYQVKAEVMISDAFSAHGDFKEMLQYLSCQNPNAVEKIFLVHGDLKAQEHFKEELKLAGFNNIHIPAMHTSYTI